MTTIIDLFAGPGGWDHGLREHLGIGDVVGVELDDNCVATRREANLLTRQGDVAATDPWSLGTGTPEGLIASPPCQPFSRAGKRDGMRDLIRLGTHAERFAQGDLFGPSRTRWVDERAPLILEPLRWAIELEPTWIALEQVPPCLPMWEVVGDVLSACGYHVWTGILNAADYGVPQTRKRAFLMSHIDDVVFPPEPTHGETPGLGQRPWVTMAEALGWGMGELKSRRDSPKWVEQHGERPNRQEDQPAPSVTGEAFRWEWERNDQTDSGEVDKDWPNHRPATTVVGRDLIPDPGANANRYNGKQKSRSDGVKVTPEQAGVLQGFPSDYPWQGSKTAKFQQIGDAVPPPLAAHVVGALTGIDMREAPYAIPA